MLRARGSAGFTLLELLIALAIVAILATLAYPDYRAHVQRGRRVDAIGTLLSLRVAQELWRGQHRQYADLTELGWIQDVTPDGHYRIRITAHTPAGFIALATPRSDGPQHDDACGVFAIDQEGPVLTTGYAGADCWRR